MSFDTKDTLNKIAKQRMVVGLDISDEFSMISYFSLSDRIPTTVPQTPGKDDVCVPTVLGKKLDENYWTFGDAALAIGENKEGTCVFNLLSLARIGKLVTVENRDYDPVDLLALFVKKCFMMLKTTATLEKVSVFTITVDRADARTIEILRRAIETLRIPADKVIFQSHSEAAYQYIINQQRDIYLHDVVICHLTDQGLFVRTMSKNIHTSPVVVLMGENKFDHIKSTDFINATTEKLRQKDIEFWHIMQGMCAERQVSSIYLIGEAFSMDWLNESLRFLSKNKRVFRGSNLFCEGASYGGREVLEPTAIGKNHVFLGKDKVKANVGMKVIRDGEEVYMALIDAGRNWYETGRECEFILEREEVLEFIVTPLNGKRIQNVSMYLTGIPLRPGRSTRIHLEMKMVSESKLAVSVTDMGFGDFFEASGLAWNTEIKMD